MKLLVQELKERYDDAGEEYPKVIQNNKLFPTFLWNTVILCFDVGLT